MSQEKDNLTDKLKKTESLFNEEENLHDILNKDFDTKAHELNQIRRRITQSQDLNTKSGVETYKIIADCVNKRNREALFMNKQTLTQSDIQNHVQALEQASDDWIAKNGYAKVNADDLVDLDDVNACEEKKERLFKEQEKMVKEINMLDQKKGLLETNIHNLNILEQ